MHARRELPCASRVGARVFECDRVARFESDLRTVEWAMRGCKRFIRTKVHRDHSYHLCTTRNKPTMKWHAGRTIDSRAVQTLLG